MDTEKDFLILLSEVARHIRTHGYRNARKHGMTWAQLMILSRLERQPGLSQNELAAIAEVAPITVTRFVDRMGKLRFVRRQLDPKDRRIWRLRTTPSAVPALHDSKRCSAKLEELVIKGVDSSALDAMVVGLRKLKANLSKSRRPVKASREGCPMPKHRTGPGILGWGPFSKSIEGPIPMPVDNPERCQSSTARISAPFGATSARLVLGKRVLE